MPLRAKVANKVTTNEQGLTEGTIINVLDVPEHYRNSKGELISEEDYYELKELGKTVQRFEEQFEFHIQIDGTQKNVTQKIWTRQKFNNEKYEKPNKPKEPKDYNDFTRLMLQLELIEESDLKDLDDLVENFDVESVKGLRITFQSEASKKSITLKVPKLNSIKPVKPPK